jgi:signal transduction histidine kinase
MAPPDVEPPLPWKPVEALGVFMALLAEVETATPASSQFYDRLCEAACRLAHLRRAVIFAWDGGAQRVRAVGSRGVPLAAFADVPVSAVTVPIARAALEGDHVVEAHERFEDHIPAGLVAALSPRNLVCTPMSAGGLWFGVLVAERDEDGPLTEPERHTLWTLGKVAGLAASARIATRQQERAGRLAERVALARDLHESVIQRLFAVGMVLGAEAPLSEEDRARAAAEVSGATQELRAALGRPPDAPGARPDPALANLLARAGARRDPGAQVPTALEPLAAHVLGEALRNARKHAADGRVDVTLCREEGALVLAVFNDGASDAVPRRGLGLHLAALEAEQRGARVEFGPEPPDGWRVRLVMSTEDPA